MRFLLTRLDEMGYGPDIQVQCSLDPEFMSLSILDGKKSFEINGDKFRPGISITNSEVGLASLSIAAFLLRLVCTNGMVSKTEISASYRHVSTKILDEFPQVMDKVSYELGSQKHKIGLSMESKIEDPLKTIESFNRQFQLNQTQKEAVEWAWPQRDAGYNVCGGQRLYESFASEGSIRRKFVSATAGGREYSWDAQLMRSTCPGERSG